MNPPKKKLTSGNYKEVNLTNKKLNRGILDKTAPVKYIGVHHTGTDNLDKALKHHAESNEGYHYIIDTDGTVVNIANTNERVNHWGGNSNKDNVHKEAKNNNSIAISYVSKKGELSENQKKSGVLLLKKLSDEFKIDTNHVLGHGDVSRKGHRHEDEGYPLIKAFKETIRLKSAVNIQQNKPIVKTTTPSEQAVKDRNAREMLKLAYGASNKPVSKPIVTPVVKQKTVKSVIAKSALPTNTVAKSAQKPVEALSKESQEKGPAVFNKMTFPKPLTLPINSNNQQSRLNMGNDKKPKYITQSDSVSQERDYRFKYESTKGARGGKTGVSANGFTDPKWVKKYPGVDFNDPVQAAKVYDKEFAYPNSFKGKMRNQLADYSFNSGRDIHDLMLLADSKNTGITLDDVNAKDPVITKKLADAWAKHGSRLSSMGNDPDYNKNIVNARKQLAATNPLDGGGRGTLTNPHPNTQAWYERIDAMDKLEYKSNDPVKETKVKPQAVGKYITTSNAKLINGVNTLVRADGTYKQYPDGKMTYTKVGGTEQHVGDLKAQAAIQKLDRSFVPTVPKSQVHDPLTQSDRNLDPTIFGETGSSPAKDVTPSKPYDLGLRVGNQSVVAPTKITPEDVLPVDKSYAQEPMTTVNNRGYNFGKPLPTTGEPTAVPTGEGSSVKDTGAGLPEFNNKREFNPGRLTNIAYNMLTANSPVEFPKLGRFMPEAYQYADMSASKRKAILENRNYVTKAMQGSVNRGVSQGNLAAISAQHVGAMEAVNEGEAQRAMQLKLANVDMGNKAKEFNIGQGDKESVFQSQAEGLKHQAGQAAAVETSALAQATDIEKGMQRQDYNKYNMDKWVMENGLVGTDNYYYDTNGKPQFRSTGARRYSQKPVNIDLTPKKNTITEVRHER